jgi:hypothetical protein
VDEEDGPAGRSVEDPQILLLLDARVELVAVGAAKNVARVVAQLVALDVGLSIPPPVSRFTEPCRPWKGKNSKVRVTVAENDSLASNRLVIILSSL